MPIDTTCACRFILDAGPIPRGFGDLVALTDLSLSGNKLVGELF